MLSLRLALRALRWRGAASVTVFLVALVGITAAAVGPIYLHAVDETVLSQRLLTAPQTQRDLRIDRSTTAGVTGVDWHVAMLELGSQAADPPYFDPPVYSEQAPIEWSGLTRYASEFAALDGLCQHVHVVAGACVPDDSRNGIVVTQRTASGQHLHVGQVLEPEPTETEGPVEVRIVGIVAPIRPDGAYWAPWNYLSAVDTIFDTRLPQLDAFFVSHRMLYFVAARHRRDVDGEPAAASEQRPSGRPARHPGTHRRTAEHGRAHGHRVVTVDTDRRQRVAGDPERDAEGDVAGANAGDPLHDPARPARDRDPVRGGGGLGGGDRARGRARETARTPRAPGDHARRRPARAARPARGTVCRACWPG